MKNLLTRSAFLALTVLTAAAPATASERFRLHCEGDPLEGGLSIAVSDRAADASVSWDAAAGDFIAEARYRGLAVNILKTDERGELTELNVVQRVAPGARAGFWARIRLDERGKLKGKFFARENDGQQDFTLEQDVDCGLTR